MSEFINLNQWTQNEVHNIEIIGVETKLVSDILCYELTFIFLRHPYEKMKIFIVEKSDCGPAVALDTAIFSQRS